MGQLYRPGSLNAQSESVAAARSIIAVPKKMGGIYQNQLEQGSAVCMSEPENCHNVN